MLKAIFSSNTRVKLFKMFLLSPQDKEFFIRELTRLLDEQINSVRRELNNLKKIGFLRVKNKNRKKYYRVNPDFLIYEELKSIFQKGNSRADEITKKISRMGKVDLLILSGSFVGKKEGIDILVVGDIDKTKLSSFITTELQSEKEIRYSVLSQEDFVYRLECKDKFIKDILSDTKNLTLINKLEKMLE